MHKRPPTQACHDKHHTHCHHDEPHDHGHSHDHSHSHDHGHVHDEHCQHGHREPFVRHTPKVGRNDPCPCGSTKKFKKCCGQA